MDMDRRTLLGGAAALPLAAPLAAAPRDDEYWEKIAREYDVTREVIQLEHGNWGMMARPVLSAYRAHVERVNRDNSYYARRTMVADLDKVRARLAEWMGVAFEEIALTRNATEALKGLILQYNRLKPGDAILYADLDYFSMQACVDSLVHTRGIRVIKIALPEPATHISHRTGLAVPVAEIAALAKARGIDVIVDAAHSVGQLDFKLPDTNADFIGMNVHKWLGAPLGVGAIYVRRERQGSIDVDPAESVLPPSDLASRVHTGTPDYAAQLTVPDALAFQDAIGGARRAARLKALRDRWVKQVVGLPQVQILTPEDPSLHGAITSFRIRGRTSKEDNVALAKTLLDKHRIFTVFRDGVASGCCVRVTPALASRTSDCDALAAAIRSIVT